MSAPVVKEGYHESLENSQWFVNNIKPNIQKAYHFMAADGGIVTVVRTLDKYGRLRITIIKHSPTGYIIKVVSFVVNDARTLAELLLKLSEA